MDAKSPANDQPNAHTADKMKTVKTAWDAAPAGPKKDSALKHYEAAQKAGNDTERNRALDAATHALA